LHHRRDIGAPVDILNLENSGRRRNSTEKNGAENGPWRNKRCEPKQHTILEDMAKYFLPHVRRHIRQMQGETGAVDLESPVKHIAFSEHSNLSSLVKKDERGPWELHQERGESTEPNLKWFSTKSCKQIGQRVPPRSRDKSSMLHAQSHGSDKGTEFQLA
jgi:hypothetical protein